MVMVCDAAQREASRAHVADLLRNHHLPLPDAATTHIRMDMGTYRIRWELHTEFVTWTFMRTLSEDEANPAVGTPTPQAAIGAVPQLWLQALPGLCLSSLNLWLLTAGSSLSNHLIRQNMDPELLIGSTVAGGFGEVYTDFAMGAQGYSNMVLLVGAMNEDGESTQSLAAAPDTRAVENAKMTPRRLGRLVQRLLEIETYRMTALMGLPAAREASGVLAFAERELAALAGAIRSASRSDEPELLDRLTRLAGQVESQHAATHSRFSASAAYFELVDKRIADITETRLGGMQTIRDFMDRRLTPARSTCEWAARRQNALSERVSRISNLLRTRVEIEQQQSSQALLATMNDRQGVQLQLQSTVEGLSVAAITYYIVGLVTYLAKGAGKLGWPWSPESTAAAAIPAVALAVWWSLRRMHHKLFNRGTAPH
jgi:uncharacterized membrane-anchored protein